MTLSLADIYQASLCMNHTPTLESLGVCSVLYTLKKWLLAFSDRGKCRPDSVHSRQSLGKAEYGPFFSFHSSHVSKQSSLEKEGFGLAQGMRK